MSRSRNLSYLPELNIFLLELVGKDRGPEIWTYRYRKGPKPQDPPSGVEVVTEAGKATLTWKGTGDAKSTVPRPTSRGRRSTRRSDLQGRTVPGRGPRGRQDLLLSRRPVRVGPHQPRVLLKPVVSVLASDKVEVSWNGHPAKDIAGYNVYRGVVSVQTVKKGTPAPGRTTIRSTRNRRSWRSATSRPSPGSMRRRSRRRASPTRPSTSRRRRPSRETIKYAVHAYIVRAVNRLGTESGPSPYALTIPSEPENVLLREKGGAAEIRWDPSKEKGVAGYLVYEIADQKVARITPELVKATTFSAASGSAPKRYSIVAVDAIGQEGQPSSLVWCNKSYKGFYPGEWHQ
jgi:hypothetical protein